MIYDEFKNRISIYMELFEKGLKKQANEEMRMLVNYINTLPENDIDTIMYRFLSEYCDLNIWNFLKKRGNADIPFELKKCIRLWLQPKCDDNKMPELRWYYEMYHNDPVGHQIAVEYLEKAYLSDKCDQKTVDMLFDSYLDVLGWGAHHFPEGCIIASSVKEDCIQNCENILNENNVSEHLANEFQYYRKLYECYDCYVKDGRTGDFDTYLAESDIDYYYNKAFYYSK